MTRTETRKPFARILTAVMATFALAAAPLLGSSPVHAAPLGYTGVLVRGSQAWPDAVLAPFDEGAAYSDALRAPFDYDDRDHGVAFEIGGTLPDGLTATVRGTQYVDITGTPTSSGPFTFSIIWYGTEGDYSELEFTVTVESSKIATSPVLSVTSPVTPYDSVVLTATVDGDGVSGTPSGDVGFWTDPATWGTSVKIGTGTLDGTGTATSTWTTMATTAVGTSRGFIAKYEGDDVYQAGDSAVATTVPYLPTATGVVSVNGIPVSGATVRLLDASDPSVVAATDTTDASGAYELTPSAPSTVLAAQKQYLVAATVSGTVVYYNTAGDPEVTDVADADAVSRLTWDESLDIGRAVPPVWTDTALATPRAGSSYIDAVAATSPSPVTYSVLSGVLPAGLLLDGTTGAITGTPSCGGCAYTFEVKAANVAGWVSHSYAGTILPAGVPPTWTDDVLRDDLQVGLALTDGVTAVGDATIVYAVATGSLPPGLVLDTATGAVTGTPTTAGTYTFRLSAQNDYGTITADFVREVAAAPELDLQLNFAAGTRIEDADTEISASGLKVGSTYTLTMHSTPVTLYTGIIGPGGGFTWTVALPANTPAGPHELTLTGIAPNGTTMTAHAWFLLLANGTIAAISYTGPLSAAQLALTGAGLAPLGLSALLIASGALTLIVRRRLGTAR